VIACLVKHGTNIEYVAGARISLPVPIVLTVMAMPPAYARAACSLPDTAGLTPLHRAAKLGNVDWATALLANGATVDSLGKRSCRRPGAC